MDAYKKLSSAELTAEIARLENLCNDYETILNAQQEGRDAYVAATAITKPDEAEMNAGKTHFKEQTDTTRKQLQEWRTEIGVLELVLKQRADEEGKESTVGTSTATSVESVPATGSTE